MDEEPAEKPEAYEIGYGRPPRHSRFKPGQSGNPKGKTKGQKDLKTIARAVLNEKITVQTPRGPKRMTKLEAMIHTHVNKAMKGDRSSFVETIKIAREIGMDDMIAEALDATRMDVLSEEDQAILDRVFHRNGHTIKPDPET